MINDVYGQDYKYEPECFPVDIRVALSDIVSELHITEKEAKLKLEYSTIDEPLELPNKQVRYWNENNTFSDYSSHNLNIARNIVRKN